MIQSGFIKTLKQDENEHTRNLKHQSTEREKYLKTLRFKIKYF